MQVSSSICSWNAIYRFFKCLLAPRVIFQGECGRHGLCWAGWRSSYGSGCGCSRKPRIPQHPHNWKTGDGRPQRQTGCIHWQGKTANNHIKSYMGILLSPLRAHGQHIVVLEITEELVLFLCAHRFAPSSSRISFWNLRSRPTRTASRVHRVCASCMRSSWGSWKRSPTRWEFSGWDRILRAAHRLGFSFLHFRRSAECEDWILCLAARFFTPHWAVAASIQATTQYVNLVFSRFLTW